MGFEGAEGLSQEGIAIGEKQNSLDPIGANQQVNQGDRRSCLSGSSCHYQQGFTALFLVKGFSNAANRFSLVTTLDDRWIDLHEMESFAAGATEDEPFEFVLFEKALDVARWIALVIPDPMLVAVGVEEDGTLTELGFQTIGVEFGLALAVFGVFSGAFGFDQGEGLAVISPQP